MRPRNFQHEFECSFKKTKKITADDLGALIIKNHLDRYRFHPIGLGCFFFIRKLFNAMLEEDWFNSRSEAKSIKDLLEGIGKDEPVGDGYILANGDLTCF